MAKGKKRGPVEKSVQLKRLSAKIGKKGQQAAAKFIADNSPDVVRYAFRTLPKQTSTIGKRDAARLAKLNGKEAEQFRALLEKTR